MIEDLELIGLDEDLLEEMKQVLSYDNLLNLACNYKNVKESIELLKSYGIKNINELILNRHYIFLKGKEKLSLEFSKFDIKTFVALINEDYTTIDELRG